MTHKNNNDITRYGIEYMNLGFLSGGIPKPAKDNYNINSLKNEEEKSERGQTIIKNGFLEIGNEYWINDSRYKAYDLVNKYGDYAQYYYPYYKTITSKSETIVLEKSGNQFEEDKIIKYNAVKAIPWIYRDFTISSWFNTVNMENDPVLFHIHNVIGIWAFNDKIKAAYKDHKNKWRIFTASVKPGEYNHFIFMKDGPKLLFYVNGKLISDITLPPGARINNEININKYGFGKRWEGFIHDFRISMWNYNQRSLKDNYQKYYDDNRIKKNLLLLNQKEALKEEPSPPPPQQGPRSNTLFYVEEMQRVPLDLNIKLRNADGDWWRKPEITFAKKGYQIRPGFSRDFTISMWYLIEERSNDFCNVMRMGKNLYVNDYGEKIEIIYIDNNGEKHSISQPVNPHDWKRFTVRKEKSNLKIYVNGDVKFDKNVTNRIPHRLNWSTVIGTGCKMLFDELKIRNSAHSQKEITTYYKFEKEKHDASAESVVETYENEYRQKVTKFLSANEAKEIKKTDKPKHINENFAYMTWVKHLKDKDLKKTHVFQVIKDFNSRPCLLHYLNHSSGYMEVAYIDGAGKKHQYFSKDIKNPYSWYHIAVIKNQNKLNIFINGKKIKSITVNRELNKCIDNRVILGGKFRGFIDDFRIIPKNISKGKLYSNEKMVKKYYEMTKNKHDGRHDIALLIRNPEMLEKITKEMKIFTPEEVEEVIQERLRIAHDRRTEAKRKLISLEIFRDKTVTQGTNIIKEAVAKGILDHNEAKYLFKIITTRPKKLSEDEIKTIRLLYNKSKKDTLSSKEYILLQKLLDRRDYLIEYFEAKQNQKALTDPIYQEKHIQLDGMFDSFDDIVKRVAKDLGKGVKNILNAPVEVVTSLDDIGKGLITNFDDILKGIGNGTVKAAKDIPEASIQLATEGVTNIIDSTGTMIQITMELPERTSKTLPKFGEGFFKQIPQFIGGLPKSAGKIFENISKGLENFVKNFGDALCNVWDQVKEHLVDPIFDPLMNTLLGPVPKQPQEPPPILPKKKEMPKKKGFGKLALIGGAIAAAAWGATEVID